MNIVAKGFAKDAKKGSDLKDVVVYSYVIRRWRKKEYFLIRTEFAKKNDKGKIEYIMKPAAITNSWGEAVEGGTYKNIPSDYVCMHDRLKSNSTVCFLCGQDTKRLGKINDDIPHEHKNNLVYYKEVAPTCVKKGTKEYYYCATCDDYYQDDAGEHEIIAPESIDATGHDMKMTVKKYVTLTKDGKIVNTCKKCKTKKTIELAGIKTVKLEKTKYKYNKKTIHPNVTVKDSAGNIIDERYYKVSYQKGCKKPGKYKVTVKFKAPYKGSVIKTFTIK